MPMTGTAGYAVHMRLLAVFILAAGLCAWAGSARAQTFSHVLTQPDLGLFDKLLAVADLDGDGRDDILAGGLWEYDAYHATDTVTPEDRFTKTTLHVFAGTGDGSFRHAPELVEGTIAVRSPIVVADDFDGRVDIAVFDEGVYVFAVRFGLRQSPQVFLSSPDGPLRPSDAVRREHAREEPGGGVSGPADLHLKSARRRATSTATAMLASRKIGGPDDPAVSIDSVRQTAPPRRLSTTTIEGRKSGQQAPLHTLRGETVFRRLFACFGC